MRYIPCLSGWRRTKDLEDIGNLANATLPENTVHLSITCAPQTSDGVVNDEIVFGLRILSLASFCIRPVKIESISATLHYSSPTWQATIGSVVFPASERPLAIGKEFLETGEAHVESIRGRISWHPQCPPTSAAVSLGFGGVLTIHGPWSSEYKETPMRPDPIFVRVTTGTGSYVAP